MAGAGSLSREQYCVGQPLMACVSSDSAANDTPKASTRTQFIELKHDTHSPSRTIRFHAALRGPCQTGHGRADNSGARRKCGFDWLLTGDGESAANGPTR